MYNAITLTCKKKKKLAKQKIRNKFTLSKLKKKKREEHEKRGTSTMHLTNCYIGK